MGSPRITTIAVLTSSRADFGIYLPLLKALKARPEEFSLEIIAFGTHLSPYHGMTAEVITDQGFEVKYRVPSLLLTDTEESIATSYALTALKFSTFWADHQTDFDWVLCLGDRYEMAAAVMAGIPFGIRFAHIGGGETTLGAIDNVYRHCITLASKLHLVQLKENEDRVKELFGGDARCIVTGSLSLQNLADLDLLTIKEFSDKWNIDLDIPSILVAIHPETIAAENNEKYAKEIFSALLKINPSYQLIINMPNADTLGTIYRSMFQKFKLETAGKAFLIENFGTQSYFTCLKHVKLFITNSSSGIIEAATFEKYVLNLGNRQKGRLTSNNVIHLPFEATAIVENAEKYAGRIFNGKNIYHQKDVTRVILETFKSTLQ